MADGDAPWHAHIYYDAGARAAAAALRARFCGALRDGGAPQVRFVGRLTDGPVGPHPIPQFEVHFAARALPEMVAAIEAAGLTALVHPLTDDDVADHTRLARWLGEPLPLDLAALDPPGRNQGLPRFGRSDV